MRHFQPQFCSDNLRIRKGDRETYSGIEQCVVVGIVSEIPAKGICVEAKLAGERLCDSYLEKVSASGLNRKSHNDRVYGLQLWRTGKQKILDRRRLEYAVIGRM